ncbi:MAG: hypothetical protein COB15_16440 [Flavobacteriales bacterium]|nr:MAG: hypothetical protein COB15_16440 [Flavobacteriales bacterium]
MTKKRTGKRKGEKTPTLWMDNYQTLKECLIKDESINPRIRGWLLYQPYRRKTLSKEKISLLDELIPLMGYDWKTGKVKVKRKPRKRSEIKGLGKRIKNARIEAGYATIDELIQDTTFAYNSVRDWENGISYPSLGRFVILCEKYEVSADFLLFED